MNTAKWQRRDFVRRCTRAGIVPEPRRHYRRGQPGVMIHPDTAVWQEPVRAELLGWHRCRAQWLSLVKVFLPQTYRRTVAAAALPETPQQCPAIGELLCELGQHFPAGETLEEWSPTIPVYCMCEPPWEIESEALDLAELFAHALLGHEMSDGAAEDRLAERGHAVSIDTDAGPSWERLRCSFVKRGADWRRMWRVIELCDGSTGNPLCDDHIEDYVWWEAQPWRQVSLRSVRTLMRYGADLTRRQRETDRVSAWLAQPGQLTRVAQMWNACQC